MKKILRKKYIIKAGEYKIELGEHTKIMGILNVTPDSFSGDGCYIKNKAILKAKKLIKDGADIIDIGGESTKPGASKISVKEEIKRVIPVIERLSKTTKVPISVDTYKTEVAKRALDNGATIVNNIMGTSLNKGLLRMVKSHNASIVLMHIKGNPQNMQKNVKYSNLITEIINLLRKSIENCLEIGIKRDKIIVDPGIGFGKTVENNLEIINRLDSFSILKQPILVGTSRKSFIGKVLDKDVKNRLTGTVSSVCASILRGAHIIRVHDIKQIKEAITLTDAIINERF
ncbi:MAG: dihydropteroate synthase [Candidatus Zapsychrus exili]|nr:dihydropteroate synthase [Candidatus Zapsychrus exili]